MTRLEQEAFDWAAEKCGCKPGEDCVAQALMDGYLEGFQRGVASVVVDTIKED